TGVTRIMELFFFSSRRRHTRWPRDWSSDVCSSDLSQRQEKRRDSFGVFSVEIARGFVGKNDGRIVGERERHGHALLLATAQFLRSEERRVGKEGRTTWEKCHYKNKSEA